MKNKLLKNTFILLSTILCSFSVISCSGSNDENFIPVESISLKESLEIEAGHFEDLVLTVNPINATNKKATWSSSNPNVANVYQNGHVIANKGGNSEISATLEGKRAVCNLTVLDKSVLVNEIILEEKVTIYVDEFKTLSASALPNYAFDKNIEWSSSDSTIVSVDDLGLIRGIKAGKATIKASVGSVFAECSVTVNDQAIHVSAISIPGTKTMDKNSESSIVATIIPENASFTEIEWASSDENIAVVNNNGVIIAKNTGSCYISCSCDGVVSYCLLQVVEPIIHVEQIVLNSNDLSLILGDKYTLTATVYPENTNNKTVTWFSTNYSVVYVDTNGNIRANNIGSATVEATCDGKTAKCTVNVLPVPIHVESIIISSSLSLEEGKTKALTAKILPEDSTFTEIIWKSSDSKVATISSNGLITAVLAGKTIITAECDGVTAECELTVTEPIIDKKSVHQNVYNISKTSTNFAIYNGIKWSTEYKLAVNTQSSSDPHYDLYKEAYIFAAKQFASVFGGNYADYYSIPKSISKTSKYIVLNTILFNKDGTPSQYSSLDGTYGYWIQNYGDAIFLYADSEDGYHLGILKILKEILGYDCLGYNDIVYKNINENPIGGDSLKLPLFDACLEIPDYSIRVPGSAPNNDLRYQYGFSTSCHFRNYDREWHNSLYLAPYETYGSTHSKWYSSSHSQLCYTAHGDINEYEALVNLMYGKFKEYALNSSPNHYMCLSVMDGIGGVCNCSACQNAISRYGSIAAAMMKFMNSVSELLYNDKEVLDKISTFGDIKLGMLSYFDNIEAPSKNLDEIKFGEHQFVVIAPANIGGVYCDYTTPLSLGKKESNMLQYENLKAWSRISPEIGIYCYSCLFQNYFIPYDSFTTQVVNHKDFYNLGARYIFDMTEYKEQLTTFNSFKEYINSKTMIDTSIKYSDLKTEFFTYKYGEAKQYVEKFFDKAISVVREKKDSGYLNGHVNQSGLNPSLIYSYKDCCTMLEYINSALNALNPYGKRYGILKYNIQSEAMFVYFILLQGYSSKLSSSEKDQYRKLLKQLAVERDYETLYGESSNKTWTSYFSWWNSY